MSTTTPTRLSEAVEQLLPIVEQHRDAAESERHLARPVVDAMRDAGLFRMFVPQQLGGLELTARDGFEILERISRVDSAAGWNLQIAAGFGVIGALLPEEGAREVFSEPGAIGAGGFNPPGAAVPVEGGYRLSGRWPFASGCQHATWLVCTGLVMRNGEPEMGPHGPTLLALLFRPSEAGIVETWNPLGMRGTGSHDVVAEDVFVPETRAAELRPTDDPGPAYRGPFYRLGVMPVVLGNAVVSLGIARAAIDEAVELARTKIPAFQQVRPVDRGVVQAHLARAEAELGSARAYFYEAIDEAWESVTAGAQLAIPQRLKLQLAGSNAAEAAASAVDHVHAAMGSSGVLEGHFRFAQHFRDVHTITQHALCSPTRFESMGQVMLGLETDWALFYL